MTTKFITLKIWNSNKVIVAVNQGEINSRALQITVLDNDNSPYDLTNSSVQFYMEKPDGKIIFNSANITDAKNGVLTVAFTSEMTSTIGVCKNCFLNIIKTNSEQLRVGGVDVYILEALDDEAVESSNEFSALTNALMQCTQLVFDNLEPSDNFFINHNLSSFPKVTLLDMNSNIIYADVHYPDENNIKISLSPPCACRAVLN
ncbi:MAG: BppU family phage baseplate upper protein [Clostridia bacterium]|nr:BppU family phage baseplate upper protein [Clostridia bacterium]